MTPPCARPRWAIATWVDAGSHRELGAMALGAIAFLGWMHYSGGSQALYHIQSRKTGETMMTAPLRDQLAMILASPLGYVHILVTSVIERAPVYALQIVGRFGWNAILLPLLAYPLAALMLAAGVATGSAARFGLGQRIWWLAVALGVALLVETAMYLTGTPLGADYIQGTQGRYFLPVLPLVLGLGGLLLPLLLVLVLASVSRLMPVLVVWMLGRPLVLLEALMLEALVLVLP